MYALHTQIFNAKKATGASRSMPCLEAGVLQRVELLQLAAQREVAWLGLGLGSGLFLGLGLGLVLG